jgi:hypothetical protein
VWPRPDLIKIGGRVFKPVRCKAGERMLALVLTRGVAAGAIKLLVFLGNAMKGKYAVIKRRKA